MPNFDLSINHERLLIYGLSLLEGIIVNAHNLGIFSFCVPLA